MWEVKATTKAISELADHLAAERVERVVLESTSDYWRPFYYLLEAAGLTVWLVNARQVKNVPRRPKSDKIGRGVASQAGRAVDGLAQLRARRGDAPRSGSGRARFDLVEDRTRVKQRVEKLLEDSLVKISSVLTDIHGLSGRAMMEALIAGERDPKRLAGLAKGKVRARLGALEEAADGHFTNRHARLARLLVDQIDDLSRRITTLTSLLDEAITTLPQPAPDDRTSVEKATVDAATGEITTAAARFSTAVERILGHTGRHDSARAIIGEIGLDMTVFGTAGRLCSWAKVSPRTVQSGRKTGRGATGKGNPYLKAALGQMATGAAKTDTFLGQRYRRLIRRMPQSQSPRRHRALRPGHHLPPPRRPHHHLQRPRPGLLHQTPRHAKTHPQPRQSTRSPRPARHPDPRRISRHSQPTRWSASPAGLYPQPHLAG